VGSIKRRIEVQVGWGIQDYLKNNKKQKGLQARLK
jgi:hypothetical protein